MKSTFPLLVGVLLAATVHAQETNTLKAAFKDHFLIGAALNAAQFFESNEVETAIVKTQFNSISPENVLKWESVHPLSEKYDFTLADKYVDFGQRHQMFIIGHTLIWHSQTPAWVFENHGKPASRETMLQRMREHIHTVVGRYRSRVKGWDVVNEALDEAGQLRATPWLKSIGEDYIQKAFQFAHEADPQAELYYNDYGLENEPKRKGALALVNKLRSAGVKLDGIGIQEHVNLTWPVNDQLDATLTEFSRLDLKIMITELDVDVLPENDWRGSAEITMRLAADPQKNPYTNGLPVAVQTALAKRYAELFAIYLKHRESVSRVTFWGVTDKNSWLNNWPIPGRTAYPLLFGRDGNPKAGFSAVMQIAKTSTNVIQRSADSSGPKPQ